MTNKNNKPKVISLFTGCGGLDLGFHNQGYDTVWANDFAHWACETFKKNLGDVIVEGDIEKIDPYNDKNIPNCDIILGGFPCQDFSMIWKQPGLNGERGNLYKSFLRFVDAKSDKFWWIESLKNEFVVNYGKIGTSGRYQIKECASEKECEKEVEKLISQKIKKGYKEYPEFDFDNHFYFDDEELGLHPLTSHPNFRRHFTDEIYFDCIDDEAPFGSDEGSDTLGDMQELVRKKGWFDFSLYPQSLIENEWDMKYICPTEMSEDAIKELLSKDEANMVQSYMVTYASAFAQIKITGYVNRDLKEKALLAIRQMDVIAKLKGWMMGRDNSEVSEIMLKDLSSFDKYK